MHLLQSSFCSVIFHSDPIEHRISHDIVASLELSHVQYIQLWSIKSQILI